MGKMLLTGVDGNLGGEAARILLEIAPHDQLIFTAYSEASLAPYAEMGIDTRVTDFNNADGLAEAFAGAERLALISMPFVGPKRQAAHRNAVDAAKFIFDENGLAVKHRLFYMCTEDYYNSSPGNFHSTQNFILQYENVKFFDRW